MICRSVRRAASSMEATVIAAIARAWIATIGSSTCWRIDQRMRPHPCQTRFPGDFFATRGGFLAGRQRAGLQGQHANPRITGI